MSDRSSSEAKGACRDACPTLLCLRKDGFLCPDFECAYELGIYDGPLEDEMTKILSLLPGAQAVKEETS